MFFSFLGWFFLIMKVCTEYSLAARHWLILENDKNETSSALSLNFEKILYSNKEGKKGGVLRNDVHVWTSIRKIILFEEILWWPLTQHFFLHAAASKSGRRKKRKGSQSELSMLFTLGFTQGKSHVLLIFFIWLAQNIFWNKESETRLNQNLNTTEKNLNRSLNVKFNLCKPNPCLF